MSKHFERELKTLCSPNYKVISLRYRFRIITRQAPSIKKSLQRFQLWSDATNFNNKMCFFRLKKGFFKNDSWVCVTYLVAHFVWGNLTEAVPKLIPIFQTLKTFLRLWATGFCRSNFRRDVRPSRKSRWTSSKAHKRLPRRSPSWWLCWEFVGQVVWRGRGKARSCLLPSTPGTKSARSDYICCLLHEVSFEQLHEDKRCMKRSSWK